MRTFKEIYEGKTYKAPNMPGVEPFDSKFIGRAVQGTGKNNGIKGKVVAAWRKKSESGHNTIHLIKAADGKEIYSTGLRSWVLDEPTNESKTKPASKAKNYTRKGGAGEQTEWLITLTNGKTKKVMADSKKSAKEHLSSDQLIVGVKSIKPVE